jgi:hypothetical protein
LEAGELAFPNLPNTLSNSSCSNLPRNLSDLQTSLAENNDKKAYEWFVPVDEDPVHEKDYQPSRLSAIPDLTTMLFASLRHKSRETGWVEHFVCCFA